MAYTSRKSSFSAPATISACHVSPPSVVRTNVPPVPLTQTTLPLTMLNPCRQASVVRFLRMPLSESGGNKYRENQEHHFQLHRESLLTCLDVLTLTSLVSCRAVDSQVTKRKGYAFCLP